MWHSHNTILCTHSYLRRSKLHSVTNGLLRACLRQVQNPGQAELWTSSLPKRRRGPEPWMNKPTQAGNKKVPPFSHRVRGWANTALGHSETERQWLRGTLSTILSGTANRAKAFHRLTAQEHCLGRSEQPEQDQKCLLERNYCPLQEEIWKLHENYNCILKKKKVLAILYWRLHKTLALKKRSLQCKKRGNEVAPPQAVQKLSLNGLLSSIPFLLYLAGVGKDVKSLSSKFPVVKLSRK